MRAFAIPLLAALVALPAIAAAGPPDRHPGFYKFVPAPAEYCREQVRRSEATPRRPQRLTDLPPAYAIRVKGQDRADAEAAESCARLQRER